MYYIPLTKSERNLYDDDKNMNFITGSAWQHTDESLITLAFSLANTSM